MARFKTVLTQKGYNPDKEILKSCKQFVKILIKNPHNISNATILAKEWVEKKYGIVLPTNFRGAPRNPSEWCTLFCVWYYGGSGFPKFLKQYYGVNRLKDLNLISAMSGKGGHSSVKNMARGETYKQIRNSSITTYLEMRIKIYGQETVFKEIREFTLTNKI